ncbi:hypothetical protein [Larkinella terrae]|uniref:Uncharacterized protein n=1 Tax=Larkinella terrae TaxID=2025311 RepID=A0A7K0EEA7_9BACT|nr:hypothetical protein [Larkinella terrae]MRS60164.1 hypothetical protein [Larkinella terrae]
MKSVYRLLENPLIAGGVLVLPVLLFFVYFFRYSFDIPWFDDFENIPYFLHRFLDAPTWTEKWSALLRPNNEHRVVLSRLVVWLYYLLTGTINFHSLMLIGNLCMLVVLFLFYRTIRRASLPWWYLLPVPFLLFNAQNNLLTFTAVYTLQYIATIMMILLALYQLAKNAPVSFGLALVLGFFATFCNGNGMLVWAGGFAVLVYQKQWLRLGGWLAVAALAVYLYFLGYPVQQGNTEGFTYLLAHPFQILSGFLIFTGSLFDFIPTWPLTWRFVLPFAAGLVLVIFLGVWAIRLVFFNAKPPTHWNGFLLGTAVFLVTNTAIVALFRVRFDFGMVLWGTYRTYILVLWSVGYLIFINLRGRHAAAETARRRWLPVFLGAAFLVNLISYVVNVPRVAENRKLMQVQSFNQRYNQIGLGASRNSAFADYIEDNLKIMKDRGWYQLPSPSVSSDEQRVFEPVSTPLEKVSWVVSDGSSYINVTDKDETYPSGYNGGIYLILKSENRTYLRFAAKNRPSDRNPFRVIPGFIVDVPKQMIQPGQYRLGLYIVQSEGRSTVKYTDRTVVVE